VIKASIEITNDSKGSGQDAGTPGHCEPIVISDALRKNMKKNGWNR